MQPIRLGPFLGANRALNPKLLPPNVGVDSLNHDASKGDLRPWKIPLTVGSVSTPARRTIRPFPRDSVGESLVWMQWSTIVHAVGSFRSEDATKRTYYTGSGPPKVTDNVIGIAGAPYPTAYRDLGIPMPATVPNVTQVTPGTGDDEDRFYAYTYLSDWDEEGMPQVSGVVTCKPGATLNITNLALPPSGGGETRGINRMRIYRTVAGDSGASFFFLRDITIATSTTDDARATGRDVMPSTFYAMPPSDMKHLHGLWNGMMAGISGKSVRYCEQFKPHAWPVAYETLCLDQPVALGSFQKNLVILTNGKPRMVYGSSPESMDDTPIEFIAACVSERSAVSFGHGVCWATSDGLAYVGTIGGPRLLTEGVMLLEDWKALRPETIVASQFNGEYFGFYDDGSGTLKGFVINPAAPSSIRFLSVGYTAAFFDELGEELYVLEDSDIKRWNGGASSMTVTHRSKVFRLGRPENPGVAEVISDGYPVTLTLWAGTYGKNGWPGGALRLTKTVADGGEFYLPAGYLADDIQIELSGAEAIAGAVVAGTVEELKQT